MTEPYNYTVVIRGLDGIPLRTNAKGAKLLMQSFHEEPGMESLLLEAVDSGTPFKNKLVSVTALFPRSKPTRIVPTKVLARKATKPLVKKGK